MYEYVFFNDLLFSRFVAALTEQGQAHELRATADGNSVFIDEDIDDDSMDRIEALYDELMDEQRILIADSEAHEDETIDRVGVQYSTPEGVVAQVHLDPNLVNRLLREIAIDELQALVQSVASQVMAGGGTPLCKK